MVGTTISEGPGQGTLLALSGVNDNDALIDRICNRREAFLKALKTFKTFGKGGCPA